MKNILKRTALFSGLAMVLSINDVYAQSFEWISSTEKNIWKQTKVKLQTNSRQAPLLEVNGMEEGTVFKAWGTCFNELGWDALNMLPRKQQETILRQLLLPKEI